MVRTTNQNHLEDIYKLVNVWPAQSSQTLGEINLGDSTVHGVQNHWIEHNDSESAFGSWSSTDLLNLALFMGIGLLWKYNMGNFFLSLGKKSMIKNQVNGFIIP